MIATFDQGAVKSPTPKRTASALADVIVFCKFTLKLLHEPTHILEVIRRPKKMYVIAGNTIVEEMNPIPMDSVSESGAVFVSVNSEAQKKLSVMAAVGQVIDISRLDIAIRSWHGDAFRSGFVIEAEKDLKISAQGLFHPLLTESSPN